MTRNEKLLVSFLTRELAMSRPKGERLNTLSLKSTAPERRKRGSGVFTIGVDRRIEVDAIPRLAAQFISSAQEDADRHGPRRQGYALMAFTTSDRKSPSLVEFFVKAKRDDRITIRLPSLLKAAIEREAEVARRSIADLIIFALEDRFGDAAANNTKGGK